MGGRVGDGPGKMSWNKRPHQVCRRPCRPQPAALRNTPNSFLEERETMLLAPQTLQSHTSQNPHSIQKGGEPKQVVNVSSPSGGEVFSL